MIGPWESLLTELAESSPYTGHGGFDMNASLWENSASTYEASAADPGIEGVTGDAAKAALRELSRHSMSLSDAAKQASSLLFEAEEVRTSALTALDLLPSATPPALLRDAAALAGLERILADSFAARREWAAKRSAETAAVKFSALGSQMSKVAALLAESPDGNNAAAGTVTADGRYRIGPPQQPTYTWDEDFIYDSESANFGDFLSSEKWKAKLAGAQLLRPDLSDATAAYAHYWSNTGENWHFDYEKAYRDDSGVQADVDQQIASARQAAEELIGNGNSSFSFTGDPSVTSHYPTTENWQKAIGGHQQWSSGDVVVDGDTATMTVTVHADDHYNFNRGQADIASDAPDDENGRFTEIGWAKPFDSSGTVTRTVTWTIGDPSTVSVSPPPNGSR